ncbi:ribonuclease H family protein [Nicoliella spurrieriana]|uniref:Ribonuclease H n=1 Tax=Nicoliella spurrieriana TaxID=2925830 RepID=A0A976X5Z2_9LACO|nr:ribonuclease H family protein [Nicoliella spurrieriana]UQS87465.1 ribonuclease H family protein [Nicoliella spurrieriana]
MAHKYYAVRRGRNPGIYNSWPECLEQVKAFPKARFKSFLTRADAEEFLKGNDPTLPNAPSEAPATGGQDVITVYTDGGSRNHGNQKGGHVKDNDKAAWAYLIQMPDGSKRSAADGELGATNNRMEVMALLKALSDLAQHGLADHEIEVVSDSKYVLDAITKHWLAGWKRRGWQTSAGQPVKNEALWKQIDQIMGQFKALHFHWTKGHADNAGNVFVDEKLNEAMDQMGSSGTIKVARHKQAAPVPQVNETVKQNALSSIDGILNGDQPKASAAPGPTVHRDRLHEHPVSPDKSVNDIENELHQLHLFDDNDE